MKRYKPLFESIKIPTKKELLTMPVNKATLKYLTNISQFLLGDNSKEPEEYFKLFSELSSLVKQEIYKRKSIKDISSKTMQDIYEMIERIVKAGYRKDIKLLK